MRVEGLKTRGFILNKAMVIERLGLCKHPKEGGYFRRTYESPLYVEGGSRHMLTSIYYMLTDDSPFGLMHRNASDIIHYHHQGGAIKYWLVSPEGQVSEVVLGRDIARGQAPQLLVQAGFWKAAMLVDGNYGLISEAVSPGFDYADNELATSELVKALLPDFYQRYEGFIRKES